MTTTTSRTWTAWTVRQQQHAIHLRREGWTAQQVSDDTGIPRATIEGWVKHDRLPVGVSRDRLARLQAVIDGYLAGLPIAVIAAEGGVSVSQVEKTLEIARRRWIRFPRRVRGSSRWEVESAGRFVLRPVDVANYRRRERSFADPSCFRFR